MVYIDETGFNRHLTEKYGYSPIGVDCVLPVKGSQGNSITLIGAICTGGLVAYSIFEGGTTGERFKTFLDTVLLPRLSPHTTKIVMDNLSSHHSAISSYNPLAEIEFVFLPPYSPEFNPIEMWFAELKGKFRKRTPMCKNANEIHDRIEHIIQEENYIQKDLSPYFAHSKQELLKAYNTRLIGI